jgi:hypothetical protein
MSYERSLAARCLICSMPAAPPPTERPLAVLPPTEPPTAAPPPSSNVVICLYPPRPPPLAGPPPRTSPLPSSAALRRAGSRLAYSSTAARSLARPASARLPLPARLSTPPRCCGFGPALRLRRASHTHTERGTVSAHNTRERDGERGTKHLAHINTVQGTGLSEAHKEGVLQRRHTSTRCTVHCVVSGRCVARHNVDRHCS